MKATKDLFSTQAATYAAYRPHYPQALYDFLFTLPSSFDAAWDCGTGNGQVAAQLAIRFTHVLATDISQAQLAQAPQLPNVTYTESRAEHTPFPDHTFDLITVGTALHWFDFSAFYTEVRRVAKPGAIFAVWAYAPCLSDPATDTLIRHLQYDIVGAYWDPERRYVDEEYRTIPFPFTEVPAPPFHIHVRWTIDQLLGYLHSWSSVQHYIRAHSSDPVEAIIPSFKESWGSAEVKDFTFPLFVRIGRVL